MRYYFTSFITVLCLCFSALSYANTIQTLPIVDATQLINTSTECWYDNKRYSEGAILQVHSVTLICAAKYPQHNNSQLIWLKLDKQGNLIYPKKPATITVN